MRKWFIILSFALLVAGCGEREAVLVYQSVNDEQNKKDLQQLLRDDSEVDEANVIFLNDELLVSMQVKPWEKWNRKKVEKRWKDKLEGKYPNMLVTVSTDFKIFWETSKLVEEKNQQTIHDDLQNLKELAKEET